MADLEERLSQLVETLESNIAVMKNDLAKSQEYLESIKAEKANTQEAPPQPAPSLESTVESLTAKVASLEKELAEMRAKMPAQEIPPQAGPTATEAPPQQPTPAEDIPRKAHWEGESPLGMLNRMQDKISSREELGKLYEEMYKSQQQFTDLDKEIGKIKAEAEKEAAALALQQLKAKMKSGK